MQNENTKNTLEKNVLVLGYGITGQAVCDYLESSQEPYWIWDDQKEIADPSPYFQGQLHKDNLNSDFAKTISKILPSPGAPQDHPLLQWARTQNIPILSEIEWAASKLDGNFIGVTGTNGKSTTVKLVNELLNDAGLRSGIFGNYGLPLIKACAEPQFSYYVLEESSYQLELLQTMRHQIAICLNVTDDHLDRYKSMESYAAAKARIFKNATSKDVFIYNYDNPYCLRMSEKSPAKNFGFSLVHPIKQGGFLHKDQEMVIRLHDKEFRFDLENCVLKGWHNMENMLAALIACLMIRHDEDAVASYKKTLANFEGLPHRLQKINEENGVVFFDDSKATNVHSVSMALASFDENVILLAGGLDKNSDFTLLKGLVKEKVKTLIAFGQAKTKLNTTFADVVPTQTTEGLEEAVKLAKSLAKPGDIVLLSPACSSFDQFRNYQERGLCFQKWVKERI